MPFSDVAAKALLIFILTYGGIALGRFPRLVIDRTGIALVGAIAMVLSGVLTLDDAFASIHVGTLLLLYGLMIISVQLRLGGFYTWTAMRIANSPTSPAFFLALLMVCSAVFSSVLANDIVCLAFTPVLAVALPRRGYRPMPFLIGLAMATNLGSAATLIGNPQSMLIAQTAGLSFGRFLLWCAPPSILSLAVTYLILLRLYRGNFLLDAPSQETAYDESWPPLNVWQSTKGLIAVAVVLVLFFTPVPRELLVMAVAGVLLISRHMHTRRVLELVDWHLITMFCGLFVVVAGFNLSGVPDMLLKRLTAYGLSLENPYFLAVTSGVLSNIVSNVPAATLLLPHLPADNTTLHYTLSLATTYAGNLLTIGSIANLIVIEQARLRGVTIRFRDYACAGIPVTLTTFAILLGWIRFCTCMGW